MRRSPASRALVNGAAIVIVIYGLQEAQALLIPFLIALFLAMLTAPLVSWLRARKVPTAAAVGVVVLALFVVMSAAGALLGGSINSFINAIPTYHRRLDIFLDSLSAWLDQLPVDLPEIGIVDILNPAALMEVLAGGLRGIVSTVSNAVLVVLTVVFMLLEAAWLPAKLRLATRDGDERLNRFARITDQVQRYLAIKTVISLVTGVVVALWVAVVGLDFAPVWGLLAFLLNYIPNIGSVIAAVPAVMLALVQLGFGEALLVLLGFVAVNMILGNLVEPQLMGRTLGLSPLFIFLALVFFGWMWGPIGMLLSVPLTMIVKISLENSPRSAWIAEMLESGTVTAARLHAEEQKGASEDA